ncbi:MAG: DNA polymerase I [Sphaerochaeta sp.]
MDTPNTTTGRKQLYIVDGYGLIYRSFFGFFNNPMRDAQGNNISAVYGFFSTLLKLIREYHAHYLVIAMDTKGPTFRHEIYPEYKANRDAAPEELHSQVPIIESILKALRVPTIGHEGYEADDVIATLTTEATRHGLEAVMFTGDKDLLQLVDEHTKALRPAKKGENFYRLMGDDEVIAEFGIKASQMVDYLAILGDSSDNVPGVKGIGQKGAAKLLGEYEDLDAIYANLSSLAPGMRKKLEEGKESAYLSKRLVTLKRDLFHVESFDTPQYLVEDVDYLGAIPLFEEIGMRSIIRNLEEAAQVEGSVEREETPAMPVGSYRRIDDLAHLKKLLDQIVVAGGVAAFDLETTSLNEHEAEILGFSFSWEDQIAYYMPLSHGGQSLVDEAAVHALLKEYLEDGSIALVGQNIKYDYKVLSLWGIETKDIRFDTMVAAWLLDSTSVFNLDYLAEKYLGHTTTRYNDIVPRGKSLSDIDIDQVISYGAEDADVTWRLYILFGELLKARSLERLMVDLEMPLLLVIARMELAGIHLDTGRMLPLSEEFESRIEAIRSEIFDIVGYEFNLNSPKQLQEVLFVERGIPTGAKTRTGFSTATDVLEPLKEEFREVALILDYRMLNKLKSTYIDTLPLEVRSATGRIHPSFLQTGTETGRLSCREPNLQNIPVRTEEGKRIRSAFTAKEGCMLLSADYSQIELVVLAHTADDHNLKEAFLHGLDIHSATASRIFDIPIEMVDSDQRRVAKTINFGVMYGMGPHALSQDLKITFSEARQFIAQYFERYEAVKLFIEETKQLAEEQGYVQTLLGHVRTIAEITSRSQVERARAQRIAVNTVIQGTAADIMKLAMLRADRLIADQGLGMRLLLQIHDELIFEVPEDEIEAAKALVRQAMEGAVELSIPLRASLAVGHDWGELS